MEYACYTCQTIGSSNVPRAPAFLYERLFSFPDNDLAGDALFRLRAARLRLVLRIEHARWPDGALRVMPDLAIGQVAEDRPKEQEQHHRYARRVPRVQVRLRSPHQERRNVL